jgi:RimJ/RimL family protein N-acetyltransferase
MTPAFLTASLAVQQAEAAELLGVKIPSDWFDKQWLMRLRLNDLQREPSLQPWLLRAIVLTANNTMIGHIGFHTGPDPEYLREIVSSGIEMGYTVFPDFRRQGYAREACLALMDWAAQVHPIRTFVVSIAPDNVPSLRLAANLGFVRIGEHVDAEDGLEYIFARTHQGA